MDLLRDSPCDGSCDRINAHCLYYTMYFLFQSMIIMHMGLQRSVAYQTFWQVMRSGKSLFPEITSMLFQANHAFHRFKNLGVWSDDTLSKTTKLRFSVSDKTVHASSSPFTSSWVSRSLTAELDKSIYTGRACFSKLAGSCTVHKINCHFLIVFLSCIV
jgi:hypothetical protein